MVCEWSIQLNTAFLGFVQCVFTLVHKTSFLVRRAPICTYVQIGGAFNGAFNGGMVVLRDFTEANITRTNDRF